MVRCVRGAEVCAVITPLWKRGWRGTGRERVWGGWGEDSVGLLLCNVLGGLEATEPLCSAPPSRVPRSREPRALRRLAPTAHEIWEPGGWRSRRTHSGVTTRSSFQQAESPPPPPHPPPPTPSSHVSSYVRSGAFLLFSLIHLSSLIHPGSNLSMIFVAPAPQSPRSPPSPLPKSRQWRSL